MTAIESSEREPCYSHELTSREKQVLRFLFQTILNLGKAPSVTEIRSALNKPDDCVIRTLDELEKKDILLRKKGTQEIRSIYPFSLVPTEHQITLGEGKGLFAMCAIDALGTSIMFNRNIKIESQCEKCKQEITIEIKNQEITYVSHPQIMIWSPELQKTPAAETCCPLVNFFCCREHLVEWTKENSGFTGKISDVKQAFSRTKQNWKVYGETLGFR